MSLGCRCFDTLSTGVHRNQRIPRYTGDGDAIELDLQAGRRVLGVDLDLEVGEPFFEVHRTLAGNFNAIRLIVRASERSSFLKHCPRTCTLPYAVLAIGQPEHRPDGGVELLAAGELLARS